MIRKLTIRRLTVGTVHCTPDGQPASQRVRLNEFASRVRWYARVCAGMQANAPVCRGARLCASVCDRVLLYAVVYKEGRWGGAFPPAGVGPSGGGGRDPPENAKRWDEGQPEVAGREG